MSATWNGRSVPGERPGSSRRSCPLTRNGVAWNDGTEQSCDVIIWCTGFHPTLRHLEPLGLSYENGVPKAVGTRSVDESRLNLLGYGDWTGFASATLIGAGRTAKSTVAEIADRLRSHKTAE